MKCFFIILLILVLLSYTYCIQFKGGENYNIPSQSPKKKLIQNNDACKVTTQTMSVLTRRTKSERNNKDNKTTSTTPMTPNKPSNNSHHQEIEEKVDILARLAKMQFFQKLFSKSPERTNKRYYIPILVVADRSFMNFHKNSDYENYIKNAINMVSEYFHDSSLGLYVSVSLSRSLYLDKMSDEFESDTAFGVLNNFCAWTNDNRFSDNNEYDKHHVAVLVTREELVGKQNRSVQGATYTASACLPHKACIVARDRGLMLGVNIAHLLGHLLGASDDEHKGVTNLLYHSLMLTPVKHDRLSWSGTSSKAIANFFSGGLGKCLERQPSSLKRHPNMLPGAAYNADMQCQLLLKAPKSCYLNAEDFCKQLFCEQQNGYCVSSGTQPAQGTSCGIDKWCFNTECVHLGYRPGAVNGGWDEWQEWGSCSRTCGGGVKMSRRACNRPAPARGGRHCVGSEYRANTCNTQACPIIHKSYRAVQCAKLFGQNVTAEHRGRSSGCILHCTKSVNGRVVRMQARAADGTPCRPGTNDMCVKGACIRVGCDWVLGSSATEDRCGICGGDGNGCELVNIHHNISGPLQDNNTMFVGTLPRWSTRVKIYETQPSANHLALAVSHNKLNVTQYLVGGSNQTFYGEFKVGDLIGYYTHLLDDQDYIMIKGPLPFDINLYQVAVYKDLVPVHYSYMALNKSPHVSSYVRSYARSKSINYEWEFLDWSSCSARCEGGVQRSRARCVSPHAGLVADRYCEEPRRPRDQIRVCNLHSCASRWKVGPWRENGDSRLRTVVCMRDVKQWQSSPELADDASCAAPKPPTVTHRCFNKQTQVFNFEFLITTPLSTFVTKIKAPEEKETKHAQCAEVHKTSKNHSNKEWKLTTNNPTKPTYHTMYDFKPVHRKGSKSTFGPGHSAKKVVYKKPLIQILTGNNNINNTSGMKRITVTKIKTLLKPTFETSTKRSTPSESVKQKISLRHVKHDMQNPLETKRKYTYKQNMLLDYEKYFTIMAVYDERQKEHTNSEISTYVPFNNYNNTLKTWNRICDYPEMKTTESYNFINTIEYGDNNTAISNFNLNILDTPFRNETIRDNYKDMIIKLFPTDNSINIHDLDFSQLLSTTTTTFDFDKLKSNDTVQNMKLFPNGQNLDTDDAPHTSKNIIATAKSKIKQAIANINKFKILDSTTNVNIEASKQTHCSTSSERSHINKSRNLMYKSLIDYILDNNINFSAIPNNHSSITEPVTDSNNNGVVYKYNGTEASGVKLLQTTFQSSPTNYNVGTTSVYDKSMYPANSVFETTELYDTDDYNLPTENSDYLFVYENAIKSPSSYYNNKKHQTTRRLDIASWSKSPVTLSNYNDSENIDYDNTNVLHSHIGKKYKNIADPVRENKGPYTMSAPLKLSNVTEDEAARNVISTKSATARTLQMNAQHCVDNKGNIKYNKKNIDKKLLNIIDQFDALKIAIEKEKKHMSANTIKSHKRKRRSYKVKRDVDDMPFKEQLREDRSEIDVIDVVENINIFDKIKDINEQQLSYELYLLQKGNIYIVLVKPVQLNVSDQLYIIVKTILSHNDYKKLIELPDSKIIFDKTVYKAINKSFNKVAADMMLTNILKDIVRAKLNNNKNNKINPKENTLEKLPHDSHRISYKKIQHLITLIRDKNTHKWNDMKKTLNLGPSNERDGFMYTYFDFYKLKQLQNVFYLKQKGNKRKFNAYIILQLLNDNNAKPLIGPRERIVYNRNVFEIKNVKQIVNIDDIVNNLIKLSMIDNESEIYSQIRQVRNKRYNNLTDEKSNVHYDPRIQNLFLRKGYRNISHENAENKRRIKRHYRYQNGKGFRHRARKYLLGKTPSPNITTSISSSTANNYVTSVTKSHFKGNRNAEVNITVINDIHFTLNPKINSSIEVTNIINETKGKYEMKAVDTYGNDTTGYIEDYVPAEDESIVAADISSNDTINDLSENAYRAVGGDLPLTYKIVRPKLI